MHFESIFFIFLNLENGLFQTHPPTKSGKFQIFFNPSLILFLFLFNRAGIEKNTGTHWLRVEQPKENKIVFKQIEVEGDMLVATDKDNNVFYKIGFTKDLKGKNSSSHILHF